jgi:hypothetical protein
MPNMGEMIPLRLFFHQRATPCGGVRSARLLVGLMPVVMGKSWKWRVRMKTFVVALGDHFLIFKAFK